VWERKKGLSVKKIPTTVAALVTALALVLSAAGCGGKVSASDTSVTSVQTAATTVSTTEGSETVVSDGTVATFSDALTVAYDSEDLDATWDKSSASFITLADGSIRFDGTGATASDKKVTITAAGTYVVSGTSTDSQIVVDSEEDGVVRLILNGADITCSTSAPIYVKNAEKAILVLAEGTENVLTDGANYVLDDSESDEPNAAIFSKANLTINGTGSLKVTANYNDGITSKDDLKIVSGDITVDAVNDAIKGKDSLGVKDGTITVTADGDGMQATNDVDADKGYIDIQGGTIDITADNDGIQAQTTLLVSAGELTILTGGGSANAPADTRDSGFGGGNRVSTSTTAAAAETDSTSAKGLKAAGSVFVVGGQINIDASDDSIHSNNGVTIDGGTITLASGDQGIQGDATVDINGGEMHITQAREGIQSAIVTMKDGSVYVRSSANGISCSSSTDSASGSDMKLTVDGGYLYIDADGDGLDTNEGGIFVNGGIVVVNGPAGDNDGPLDYGSECKITGGYLLAVGSSGMAEAATDSSTQYSVMVNFDSAQAAGTLVHIQAEDGTDILTFAPTKQYQSVVLCSPDLKEGETYTVYLGGSSTGKMTDSLYSGGTYTPGTEYATLTISSMVTTSGQGGMMGGGGPGGDGALPGGGTTPGGAGRTRPGGGTPPDGTAPQDATSWPSTATTVDASVTF
jgi:hypothetical protein